MKTEATIVNGTMYCYACPKTEYEISQLDEGELPFKYTLRSFDYHSDDDAVRVCEFPVTGTVPAGIDLVMKAIEGMKEHIIEIQADADKQIGKLEEKIKALALIEYKPEVIEVIDGEADELPC